MLWNIIFLFFSSAYYVNQNKIGRKMRKMCVHELPQLCYNFTRACSLCHNCIKSLCSTYPKSINIMIYRIYMYIEKKISFSCARKLNFNSFTCGVYNTLKWFELTWRLLSTIFIVKGGKLDHLSHTLVKCEKRERENDLK